MRCRFVPLLLATLCIAACERAPQAVMLTDSCSIDAPVAESTVIRSKGVQVAGWAFDRAVAGVPDTVFVQVATLDRKTALVMKAARGTQRPDVAMAYKLPEARKAGFDLAADLTGFPPGKVLITILQTAPDHVVACTREAAVTLQ